MARYTPDHAGTRAYLQYSPELKRELHRRALLGLSAAVALAPRRSGKLAASGHVEDDGPTAGKNHDRMQFSIVFDEFYAAWATYVPQDNRAYLRAAISIMERGR